MNTLNNVEGNIYNMLNPTSHFNVDKPFTLYVYVSQQIASLHFCFKVPITTMVQDKGASKY